MSELELSNFIDLEEPKRFNGDLIVDILRQTVCDGIEYPKNFIKVCQDILAEFVKTNDLSKTTTITSNLTMDEIYKARIWLTNSTYSANNTESILKGIKSCKPISINTEVEGEDFI